MALFPQRRRLITFRVADNEYSEIEKTSLDTDSRSISDFARAAVLSHVRALSGRTGRLADDLATLTTQLTDLEAELLTLRSRISRILGSVNTANGG